MKTPSPKFSLLKPRTLTLGLLVIVCALLATHCDLNNAFLLAIHLNLKGANIAAAATTQLSVSLEPSTAATPELRWTSSDPSIATVDQKGLVTGVSAGVATITVKTTDGLKTDSCSLAVWGTENNKLVFKCANPKYYEWSYWYEPPGQFATSTLTNNPVNIVLSKTGGSNSCGYGVLFAYVDSKNYYKLLIDRTANFRLSKIQSGQETMLISWQSNADLLVNSANNTIALSKANDTLTLTFNGSTNPITLNDNSFDAGTVAFFAAIDTVAKENLQTSPVSIQYLLTSPVQIP